MEKIGLPKVSVIVTTYNRPKSLQRLLYALQVQTHTDFADLEVVIYSDGSDADYSKVQKDLDQAPYRNVLRHFARLDGNRPNLYVLKNLAAEEATGDVLWFLGDDDIVDDHTLFILRLYFAMFPKDYVLIPHLANEGDPDHYQNPFRIVVAPGPDEAEKCAHYVSFEGVALRKSLFEDVSIDEGYSGHMGFADVDWGHRLWLAGAKIVEADGIQVFMDDSETGSHRDQTLQRDQAEDDAHHNGRRFIEKWGPETAALYGAVWDENDRRQFGWVWNEETGKFQRG